MRVTVLFRALAGCAALKTTPAQDFAREAWSPSSTSSRTGGFPVRATFNYIVGAGR